MLRIHQRALHPRRKYQVQDDMNMYTCTSHFRDRKNTSMTSDQGSVTLPCPKKVWWSPASQDPPVLAEEGVAAHTRSWGHVLGFPAYQRLMTSDDTFNEMALLFELKQYGTSAGRGCILSSNYEAHKIGFRLDIMLRFVTGKLHRENHRAVPHKDSSAQ